MVDAFQAHVTPTLRKHNVNTRILDQTFNKHSRNRHSVLFVSSVMIEEERDLLYVIRDPSKDDIADKDLHN